MMINLKISFNSNFDCGVILVSAPVPIGASDFGFETALGLGLGLRGRGLGLGLDNKVNGVKSTVVMMYERT